MVRALLFTIFVFLLAFGLPVPGWAEAVHADGPAQPAAHGLDPVVLIGVAVILLIGKAGGELFERLKQPGVLGELVGGILVGNLALLGITSVDTLKTNEVITALAELGVIILLFEVGLESNIGEMLEVGWSSLLVAFIGVIAPFFLGWGVAAYFIPEESTLGHIFIGATLTATSVGITARVLKDLGRLATREARIILGAAVIDDILGLLILAVVSGAIKASATGGSLGLFQVGVIASKALLFLVFAIAAGHYLVPLLFKGAGLFESRGILLSLAISVCFVLAYLASIVGLAPIVGAFAAGLVLDEAHFESFEDHKQYGFHQLLNPISTILVPIFFVLMGLKVDVRSFVQPELLGFAALLTFVAIIGKQVCSLAVVERGINRIAIGFGMVPRGEVGLIFAGIGTTLSLPNAQGVIEPIISASTFGVVVIMVIITTVFTPPALKWAMSKNTPEMDLARSGVIERLADENVDRS
ncbi:MAG TPA: cation:proton antiporter [Blastocatellia bacterium]|jgi:Kef-type K+ transport system membrane component KefB|nr:cation:proton antiporter [Blastocatellia bacterium]